MNEAGAGAGTLAQLNSRHSAAHGRFNQPRNRASARQRAVRDQVQPPIGQGLHDSRTLTRSRTSDSFRRYNASRKRTRNVPGPREWAAASSPAIPITAMAFTAASRRAGSTAANAPARALAVHPRPVTFGMSGCPLKTRAVMPPDEIRSTAPLVTTTQPYLADSRSAASAASSDWYALSTPRVLRPSSASARISDALPRTIAGESSASSLRAVAVRNVVAPAPTGSRIMGRAFRLAASPALNIEAIH